MHLLFTAHRCGCRCTAVGPVTVIKLTDTAYWQATSEIASRLVPVLRQPPENRSQSELDTVVSVLSRIELFGTIDANHLREVCTYTIYWTALC